MLAGDSFGDGEPEAGAFGVESGGGEGLEESGEEGWVDAGAVVAHGKADPVSAVAVEGGGEDFDACARGFAAFGEGVAGVSDEVDEDLDETVGVARDDEVGADGVDDFDGSAAVEADKRGGLIDGFVESNGGEGGGAGAGEIEEAFAEPFEALDDAEHEGGGGRIEAGLWVLGESFGEPFDDGKGGVEFVGDTGGHHAEAGEAVGVGEVSASGFEEVVFGFEVVGDGFEAAEGVGELGFLRAQGGDALVSASDDLPEFVGGDLLGGDEFAVSLACAEGFVGVEHGADRGVDVAGEDERLHGRGDDGVHEQQGEEREDVEPCDGLSCPWEQDTDLVEVLGAVGDGEEDGTLGDRARARDDRYARGSDGAGRIGGIDADAIGRAGGDLDAFHACEHREHLLALVVGRGTGDGAEEFDGGGRFRTLDDLADGLSEDQSKEEHQNEAEGGVENDEFFADGEPGEEPRAGSRGLFGAGGHGGIVRPSRAVRPLQSADATFPPRGRPNPIGFAAPGAGSYAPRDDRSRA